MLLTLFEPVWIVSAPNVLWMNPRREAAGMRRPLVPLAGLLVVPFTTALGA